MAKTICVMGESGSGKTSAMRNLDPKTTYYIDADKKGLSWKGWRSQYNIDNKNYFATNEQDKVRLLMQGINDKRPDIKLIVIDTINGIMVGDEMRRAKEKGYDKWVDLACCIWDLAEEANMMRDDITIVFSAHTYTDRDENTGFLFTRIKTNGKKLDKIVLESKFTTVLYAKCVEGQYKLETQSRNSTAKSPMGAFAEFEIDNDMALVVKALEEY